MNRGSHITASKHTALVFIFILYFLKMFGLVFFYPCPCTDEHKLLVRCLFVCRRPDDGQEHSFSLILTHITGE